MKRVILESPYRGDVEENIKYARECLRDSLDRGEAPLASHLLYTQTGVLDDHDPVDRMQGMMAGWLWYSAAKACVVYADRCISHGMIMGIKYARLMNVPIEVRFIRRYQK